MKKTVFPLFLLCLALFSLVSCTREYEAEAKALARYSRYFDETQSLTVLAFEKAVYEDRVLYYIERGPCGEGDTEPVRLLIVRGRGGGEYETHFFADMEYGLHPENLRYWEHRAELAESVRVYSADEIAVIAEMAEEYEE